MTNSVFANLLLRRTTPEAWRDKLRALPVASTPRTEAIEASPEVVALFALLHGSTGPEIDAWCDDNAGTLPEIRATLKAILKLLATRL